MGYLANRQTSPRAQASTYTSGLGILLTGTTVNVKGGYVDVYSPTPDPGGFLIVELQPAGVAAAQALVDIAVGAGGSEHIIAANLGVNAGTGFSVHSIPLPLSIPAGATIRARYQRSNASLTMRCAVKVFAATDLDSYHRVQTLGATTATSRGTSLDPGGSANAKGSYVQLTAATTEPIRRMLLHVGNQGNTTRTDAQYLVDLAVGAAASESVIVPNLQFSIDDTADEPSPSYIGPFPVDIPIGSRVAARAACTITDATDRLFDLIAYGIA